MLALDVAGDEGVAGGLDDVAGDDRQLVELHDAFDLHEQAVEEPEVASGDAGDGGDGLGVGEVAGVEGEAEPAPVAVEDEVELVVAEGPVGVGEADPAVKLVDSGASWSTMSSNSPMATSCCGTRCAR